MLARRANTVKAWLNWGYLNTSMDLEQIQRRALTSTKNASMDYSVRFWQSHFKKSVEKWDDIQQRMTRWALSSSLLQAVNLLRHLYLHRLAMLRDVPPTNVTLAVKRASYFSNPALIFYSVSSCGYEFHMLRTDISINNLNNHCWKVGV